MPLKEGKERAFFTPRSLTLRFGSKLAAPLRDNSLNFAYSFPATILFFFFSFSFPLALSAKWKRIYEEGGIDLQLEKNFMPY